MIFGSKMVISGQAGLGWDERWNLLCKPDAFVALTKRNCQWVKRISPKQRVEIIPNGVDLDIFTRGKQEKMKDFTLSKPIILCVAGGDEYKGIPETIRAVAKRKKGSLLVVGGNKKTYALGKSLLNDRFEQIKVPHSQMPQMYHLADVFTLVSSKSEAFGIAYLEAMASGLGVVAPDDVLRREIVGQAGIFVTNPKDSDEYSRKLSEALDKNWGNLPRKQVSKYSWDGVADSYFKLLSSI